MELVERVLSSIGLIELYLTRFKEKGINDELIKTNLAEEDDPIILREVLPLPIHRLEFIEAFRETGLPVTIWTSPIYRPPPTLCPTNRRAAVDDDLKGQHHCVLEMKKEDEATMKLAVKDAKLYYQEQMQSTQQIRRWYPTEEFKKINNNLLAKTVQKFMQDKGLTPEQTKTLEQALHGLYLKFQHENDSRPGQSYAIGIDLGTTNSCVGVFKEGRVEIMRHNELFTVPSCVFFEEDGHITAGEGARDGAYRSPQDFIYDAKRLIGRKFMDQVVQDDIKHWSFKVVSSQDDQPRIVCRGKQYRPEQISSKLLAHMKTMAQRHLGQESVTNAVITVPAYFNEGQRQATKDAAEMAGLTATILAEPVAAAIAYGFHRNVELKKNVLVFDLGGGTFDVAILSIERGSIDVKAINGDTHLGGEDFDNEMVKFIIERLKASKGIDLYKWKASRKIEKRSGASILLYRIKHVCERTKRDLSYSKNAFIRLEGVSLYEKISREDFEALITPYLQKCMKIVHKALTDAQMKKKDIAEVILVGGSTKIPKVRKMLADFFNRPIRSTVEPDQAVAYGAAILAAVRNNTTQGEDMKGIASVSDSSPLPIGTNNSIGHFVELFSKNSKVPCSGKRGWVTVVSNDQTQVAFPIFEGDNPVARDNRLLGTFTLKVPPRPKGEVLSSIGLVDHDLTNFKGGTSDELIKSNLAEEDDVMILREAISLQTTCRHDFTEAVQETVLPVTTLTTGIDSPTSTSCRIDGGVAAADDFLALLQLSLDMKKENDEKTVELVLQYAKFYYQQEMKSTRQVKRWYPTAEFQKIDDNLLAKTVQKFMQEKDLTAEQAKSLELALRSLYLNFQHENITQPGQSYAIGIDLGTNNSCVGVYREGRVEIMRQNELFTVPSCVFFEDDGNITVGESALDGAYRSPEDFIYDAKRLIGRKFTDQVVQDDIKHWSFKVVSSPDDQPRIVCRGKPYRPEEISSKLLAHLKTIAQRHLGQKSLTNAVVTVPAYFNEGQRQATKDAAEMAGLTATILTEPVAAAIAYGFHKNVEIKKNVLVFDLGGGTFDVAILSIERGNIDVKTINGDAHLGGEDFDNELVKFIIKRLATRGINLFEGKDSSDKKERKRTNKLPRLQFFESSSQQGIRIRLSNLLRLLRQECEKKKRDLSYSDVVSIRLQEINLDEKLSREDFEALIMPYFSKCMAIVAETLEDAHMDKEDIAEIIMVGGSTKIPKVRQMLADFFGEDRAIRETVNPDQAVAYGAAILAAVRNNTTQEEDMREIASVSDVTPMSIGTSDSKVDFVELIPKSSKIPCSGKRGWVTVSENQTQVAFNKMANNKIVFQ